VHRSCLIPASIAAAVLCGLAVSPAGAQVERPKILGVAHIALKTDNLAAAANFYGHDLGFAQLPLADKNARAVFKVNDHQYIDVLQELKNPSEDRLVEIAFETSNAGQLRDYMAAHGVDVPATVGKDADGNLSFAIQDPSGHRVAFVQYLRTSIEGRNFGKRMPPSRISEHIIHVGVTVPDQAAADRLYKDVLGFHAFWHGGMRDDRTDWVDMRVPDGVNWLEYMLNVRNPSPRTLGVMHHVALGVPNVQAAYERLLQRHMTISEKPKIGRDGKWQLNLYDPNMTRVEMMEPKPVRTPCCSTMEQ
jgi:catechol 2,3-dioxygenase-like lactoylglutathione lyase family enzyme/predicted enzyme related to lactoylglutathione lyase